jgi:hypothetical protein
MKQNFTKRDDCILKGNKQQSATSFSFFTNKFLSFFVSKMSAKESFVEKLPRKFRKRLHKLRKEKEER